MFDTCYWLKARSSDQNNEAAGGGIILAQPITDWIIRLLIGWLSFHWVKPGIESRCKVILPTVDFKVMFLPSLQWHEKRLLLHKTKAGILLVLNPFHLRFLSVHPSLFPFLRFYFQSNNVRQILTMDPCISMAVNPKTLRTRKGKILEGCWWPSGIDQVPSRSPGLFPWWRLPEAPASSKKSHLNI